MIYPSISGVYVSAGVTLTDKPCPPGCSKCSTTREPGTGKQLGFCITISYKRCGGKGTWEHSRKRGPCPVAVPVKKVPVAAAAGEHSRLFLFFVYLIGQNFGGQNCRKYDLLPKILSAEIFCPLKISTCLINVKLMLKHFSL